MKKLKLSDVRKEFRFTINKNSTLDGHDLVNKKHPLVMDYDVWLPSIGVELQRLLCWSLTQKQEFILSILKNTPIPKVSIVTHKYNNGDKVHQVIDGKQRITTYISFMRGEFSLATGHFYDDLGTDCMYVMNSFYFHADIAFSYYDAAISDEYKISWFRQVNFTGTDQDINHINKLTSRLDNLLLDK